MAAKNWISGVLVAALCIVTSVAALNTQAQPQNQFDQKVERTNEGRQNAVVTPQSLNQREMIDVWQTHRQNMGCGFDWI